MWSLWNGHSSIIQTRQLTSTAESVFSETLRMPQVRVKQQALGKAWKTRWYYQSSEDSRQIEAAFEVYDSIRWPRAQKVVQDSLEVGVAYFLVHPVYGNNLQKITDDANKRLPSTWYVWRGTWGKLKVCSLLWPEKIKYRAEGQDNSALTHLTKNGHPED